jgi:hypothetical protein
MAMASTCATNFNWIRLFSFEVSKNRAIFFPNERTFDSLCTHKHEMELTTSVIEIQTYDIFHRVILIFQFANENQQSTNLFIAFILRLCLFVLPASPAAHFSW